MDGRSLWAAAAAAAALLLPVAISAAAPATLYVSPSGSDAGNDCRTRAHPCRSFGAAYRAAAPGDTVEAAGGIYEGQTIEHDDGRTAGPNVLFRPAPGATVTIAGQLSINGSYVTVRGFRGGDFEVRPPDVGDPPPVSHVTLEDVDGRNFNIFSATDVSVLGGDWGPASDCGGAFGGSNNSIRKLTEVNPSDILIDGAVIHDVQTMDLDQCHVEGLAVFAGENVTVRNSRFYGNSVYDVFVQANSGPISGLTLENNWFALPVGTDGRGNGSPLGFSSVTAGVTLRNNSINGVASLDDNSERPAFTNFVVTGNIGDLGFEACRLPGIEWSYNVWQTDECDDTDVDLRGAALPFVNGANTSALDYHLTGGPALDLIPEAASELALDIDGDRRPQGPGIDAGSDEVASEEPTATPTPASTPTSTPSPAPTASSTPAAPPGFVAPAARTLRLTAVADAALQRSAPRRRGGGAALLPVARGRDALLKFRVEGVGGGTVARARLRLWVAKGRAGRLTLRSTGAGWKESRASWRTSPKARGKAIATARGVRAGRFLAADVTTAVTRDGLVSLRLSSTARRGVELASRTQGERAPTLELSVSGQ